MAAREEGYLSLKDVGLLSPTVEIGKNKDNWLSVGSPIMGPHLPVWFQTHPEKADVG